MRKMGMVMIVLSIRVWRWMGNPGPCVRHHDFKVRLLMDIVIRCMSLHDHAPFGTEVRVSARLML